MKAIPVQIADSVTEAIYPPDKTRILNAPRIARLSQGCVVSFAFNIMVFLGRVGSGGKAQYVNSHTFSQSWR